MLKRLLKIMILLNVLTYATPMEALSEYNIILVHGAGSRWGGLDCENGDAKHEKHRQNAKEYQQAFSYYVNDPTDRIGGIPVEGILSDDTSTATGMIKELQPWIQDELFEGAYKGLVYLQRPFVNPANSPANNANEIGKRTWKGKGMCAERRSLFEEAQEIHAEGQGNLDTLRTDNIDSYRKIPSRYILVAHSMGGVASREYVQGGSLYKEDVDKVVTLDSPHEGTGAPRRKLKC